MGLMNDIGPGPVGVDTAIFIYFIEEHPRFLRVIEPLFREADKGCIELEHIGSDSTGSAGGAISQGRRPDGRPLRIYS